MKKSIILTAIVTLICGGAHFSNPAMAQAETSGNRPQEMEKRDDKAVKGASDFATKAAQMGLAEVELGKVAQEKAENEELKNFAAMMVTEHTASNAELKEAATADNVKIPEALDEKHAEKKDKMAEKSGADFDKAYAKKMVDSHKKAVKLYEKASEDLDAEGLKAYAASALPKLKAHLEEIQRIEKDLK